MITLPWPNPKLTPNAKRRSYWRAYRPAESGDRKTGYVLATVALSLAQKRLLAAMDRIPVVIRFYPPDARKRDDDGMIGAFKHMRDGIADALGVDDNKFRPVYEIMDPAKPGRVEVIFATIASQEDCC